MVLGRFSWLQVMCCALLILSASHIQADDWKQQSFKVTGGGKLELEYPLSWGKKPEYTVFDNVTNVQFGPYGTSEKPIFLVHLQSVVALDPITDEDLIEITKTEISSYREAAFETDIPIKDLQGPHILAHYFSITDSESKRGEFDYLTLALVGSGRLLIKCYFFSSAGAPDFGADAIRMMQSIKYTAPEPKS